MMNSQNTIAAVFLGIGFTLAFALPVTHADVVYDNGAGGAAGVDVQQISDQGYDSGVGLKLADDFSLATSTWITGVQWTGQESQPVEDFTIFVFADNPQGGPGNPLYETYVGSNVNKIDSGFDLNGENVYEYEANLPNLLLDGDTTYWLGIQNNTPLGGWFWTLAQNGGNHHFQVGSDPWTPLGWRPDFRLSGTSVPEPTTAGAICILGLFFAGRRNRRLELR